MRSIRHFAALVLLAAMPSVHAAESYDNCKGFIDALPATIAVQGVWCLRQNLATGITTGNAIEIAGNNITLDCNGFKVGGLSAGVSTDAFGIHAAPGRQNAVVRNCNVRGFAIGIRLEGDNHVVEHNQFDLNTLAGIFTTGDGNEIRGNTVTATGGRPAAGLAIAISADGDGARVLDNSVHGVHPLEDASANQISSGIQILNGIAIGNRISGLIPDGQPYGMRLSNAVARDNVVAQSVATPGTGIICLIDGSELPTGLSQGNTVRRFATSHSNCNESGNVFDP